MRMDIDKKSFTKKQYDMYIYGSAEVIGLMCARVFVQGENESYESLETGVKALGSAYQKVYP
jgi:phytoene/squalene synthetase